MCLRDFVAKLIFAQQKTKHRLAFSKNVLPTSRQNPFAKQKQNTVLPFKKTPYRFLGKNSFAKQKKRLTFQKNALPPSRQNPFAKQKQNTVLPFKKRLTDFSANTLLRSKNKNEFFPFMPNILFSKKSNFFAVRKKMPCH